MNTRAYYRLIFSDQLTYSSVESFVSNIGALPTSSLLNWSDPQSAIVFEVWGDVYGIHHRIGLPWEQRHLIEQLRAHADGTYIEADDGQPISNFTAAEEYGLSSDTIPLDTNPYEAVINVLNRFQPLENDETIALQWVVTPTNKTKPLPRAKAQAMGYGNLPYGRNVLTFMIPLMWNIGSGLTKGVTGIVSQHLNMREETRQVHLDKKWQGYMFNAICRIGVRSAYRAGERLQSVLLQGLGSTSSQVTFQRKSLWSKDRVIQNIKFGTVPTTHWPCLLNEHELSALLAFPVGGPKIPGLQYGGAYQAPPQPNIPTDGLIVAKSIYGGLERPIAIPWSETLRHTLAIGSNGSGKTTLLENMAVQTMEEGHGLLYIDPKGTSVERLLNYVPPSRINDVIYFDPTNFSKGVVGLNLFSSNQSNPSLTASNVVGMFKKLFEDSWGGRMEAYFMVAVHTLAAIPYMTFLDINEILTNDAFRNGVLNTNPLPYDLQKSWNEFDKLSKDKREERIQPILNKLKQFSLRPPIRYVVGQSNPALKMSRALSERKIILANLAKGSLGEDETKLLGSMLLLAFWQDLQARPQSDYNLPFLTYIDEAPDFLHLPTSIETLLAQSREFGAGLTLAAQSISQFKKNNDNDLRKDVMTNTNSAVYFKIKEPDEALLVSRQYPGTEARDFATLGQFGVLAAVSTGDAFPPRPTVGVTYPRPKVTGTKATIINHSLATYTQPATRVEEEIELRRKAYTQQPATGSRRV